MSDEFDDLVDPALLQRDRAALEAANARPAPPVPRLVSRLYAAADLPLRAKLLACLLRPLRPLGLVAIAAGAFSGFLTRGAAGGIEIVISDVTRYSNEQITELARFVEQVSPEAVRQFAGLVADNPIGIAAFSTSAALLLLRALRKLEASRHG